MQMKGKIKHFVSVAEPSGSKADPVVLGASQTSPHWVLMERTCDMGQMQFWWQSLSCYVGQGLYFSLVILCWSCDLPQGGPLFKQCFVFVPALGLNVGVIFKPFLLLLGTEFGAGRGLRLPTWDESRQTCCTTGWLVLNVGMQHQPQHQRAQKGNHPSILVKACWRRHCAWGLAFQSRSISDLGSTLLLFLSDQVT